MTLLIMVLVFCKNPERLLRVFNHVTLSVTRAIAALRLLDTILHWVSHGKAVAVEGWRGV